ncbi:PREDICTED: uncharacterized protein LOC106818741 [Priapulus caudatus]|uniref:Uncharacterized protein LOC106818741 n=1 Tax=Priapulus caudatus TaxID=37621 RepID=A0ABM1F378_PRICU|nr:PREDICTED: uncharacterized protein LOC106818741 [Priapulus caudatus]
MFTCTILLVTTLVLLALIVPVRSVDATTRSPGIKRRILDHACDGACNFIASHCNYCGKDSIDVVDDGMTGGIVEHVGAVACSVVCDFTERKCHCYDDDESCDGTC